jgi:protease-4
MSPEGGTTVALLRGLRIVLVFVTLAVFVSLVGTALMYFAVARGPSVPRSATLVLRPGGELREIAPDDVVGQLLGRDGQSVRVFWDTLRKAARDERITTVLLMPGTLELPYWGKVQELRDAVLAFRQSGKKVIAFLEYGGDREYYLASAADRVYLLPTSPLDLTGVASYEIFLRGTLERVGAYPDFLQIGKYKTAPNQLTERGFTPAHREMAISLNRDLYEQLVRGIAEARRKSDAEVRALIDRGPFTPEEALRAGLVDDLAYEDQLDDRVPELHDDTGGRRRLDGADYARVAPSAAGLRPRSRIAVLYAVGTIVSGRSRFDPINGQLVGSETLVEQIREIRGDQSIRAIVLRIDSPGGSAVASDVIWRELMITRRERPSRPLVASMSDLAASGGYYIALPAQVIVAQPATLTGSIGIFGGKIALGGAMEKLGVGYETVTSGAHADIYSPFDRFEPGARARIEQYMRTFYEGFVRKVAESRGKTPDEIDAVAQGRVWTGRQARAHGLVDALGGLQAAVEIAKARAGIPASEDVELVIFPPRRSLYQLLSERLAATGAVGTKLALAGGADHGALAALSAPVRLFRRGEPLALMPVTFVR